MRLITSYYIDKDSERQQELERCLQKNIECHAISEIILLTDVYQPIERPKVTVKYIHERPTFDAFFAYSGDGWNIVANTDIYFDDSLSQVNTRSKNEFMALCRYDVLRNDQTKFLNRVDAQDAWIYYGPTRISAPFYQGIPGCDNSLAYRAEKAGHKVTNPSLSIKCYHLHNSGVRNYKPGQDVVAQPYKLLTPHK